MNIRFFQLGPIGTNCYILTEDKETIVIDPGHYDTRFVDYIKEQGMNVTKILLTHGHFDHIGGVDMLRKATGAKVYIHEADAELLEDARKNGSAGLMEMNITVLPADETMKDGDIIDFEGNKIEVIHTPGHSKGGVCFRIKKNNVIFCGDTLFRQSIGRTDLYGGSMAELEDSVMNKLYTLEKDYVLLPGHGEETSLYYEKKHNMCFRA